MKLFPQKLLSLSLLSLFLISGCNDNDSSSKMKDDDMVPEPIPVTYSYQITVSNLTYSQPMSPIAVILHDEGQFWSIGMPASAALENLAESGDNSELLADSQVLAGISGAGLLMPGMSETIDISLVDNMPDLISIATMLVNTNDAFTGINAISLSNLSVDESISFTTSSYDSGTEKNTEMMSTIPGPASGGTGEGYNELRDDLDKVAMHPGVVTMDDGLASSALTQAHKFDNPTLKIVVMRTN